MRLTFPLAVALLLAFDTIGQPYFPVSGLINTAQFAPFVSHTAHLLNTPSRVGLPQEVRIMVYGQSISAQNWWNDVRRYLMNRYPQIRIVMVNRAIGGFSTERLKLTVDNDVVPFYPDLILLHDYGNERDYERIIQIIRSRTTADLALQTDHVGIGQNESWHDRHAQITLPALCARYGLALIDVRAGWKAYLKQNQLAPSALLTDNVHLNDHGNYLMAEIIKRHLEALPPTAEPSPVVRVLRAGVDFTVRDNILRLRLTGNRIDLVWAPSASPDGATTVVVDGQKPSTQSGCYYSTHPARQPNGFFLANIGQVLTVQVGGRPQAEEWTLSITEVDTVRQQLGFRLHGSQTGDDGAGRSDSLFTSSSGRIRIAADAWFRRRNAGDFSQYSWLKPGDRLRWRVVSMCQDMVHPAGAAPITAVQGIVNKTHLIELTGKALSGLREIHVYRPSLVE
ncbi:hypothetical protein GCM10027190_45590 [Spirosoma areae]